MLLFGFCCCCWVVVVLLIFFFCKRWKKIWKPSVSMTDTNPKRKKAVFSCTAPCIMLKFCSLKFSDLQPVDHNRLRAAGFTTDAMPACSLQQINFISGQKHYWADHIAFFFFFLLFFPPLLRESPAWCICAERCAKPFFFFFFFFSISLRWRQLGASWATITTILKGCGTVQITLAVYTHLKLWSCCYSHPQGMWDSSGHSSSL